MTPRQLHALEWAVERAKYWPMPMVNKSDIDLTEMQKRIDAATFALAYAWREYREAQSAARIKPARRDLQTVRLTAKRKAEIEQANMAAYHGDIDGDFSL